MVVAGAAVDEFIGCRAVEGIVARRSVDRGEQEHICRIGAGQVDVQQGYGVGPVEVNGGVGAVESESGKAAGSAESVGAQVDQILADHKVGDDVVAAAGLEAEQVTLAAARQGIIASAADKQVVAAPAVQFLIAAATDQRIR